MRLTKRVVGVLKNDRKVIFVAAGRANQAAEFLTRIRD
jgi:antirestriction protein ArdC